MKKRDDFQSLLIETMYKIASSSNSEWVVAILVMVLTLNYHFVGHDVAGFTQIDITLLNNGPKGKKKLLIHHRT